MLFSTLPNVQHLGSKIYRKRPKKKPPISQFFLKPIPILLSIPKKFETRYRYHKKRWKSFKTEKFRNRNVTLCNEVCLSRYFTQYTGKGRYSVKCQVSGDSDTGVNGGFIGAKVFPKVPDPHSPLCCGSDAMPPGSQKTPTGNFTRLTKVKFQESMPPFQAGSWRGIPGDQPG